MPFHSKIAGTAQKNQDGIDRQFLIRRYCRPGMKLDLRPEPGNKFDPCAIGLWVKTKVWFFFDAEFQIGYIGENLSEELSRHLAKGRKLVVTISDITGGTNGKNFGVNILIDKQ